MYNNMVGNNSFYVTSATVDTTAATDGSDSISGENLLESPDENTDSTTTNATTDTANTEGETTTTDESNLGGETTTDESNIEGNTTDTNTNGEAGTDTTGTDTGVNEGEVFDASGDTVDMSNTGDMSGMEGADGMYGETTTTKDPFLSNYVPIVGITAATLVVGVIIGILLAKKKIKKGIDLYED